MKINLERMKRDAKKRARAEGIKHTHALDLLAKEAGYQNYAHARRELGDA
ncbi:MAG: hypothetical protein WCO82_00270 [Sphingomonadales bacterium]|jgi:hypothetical protein